MDSRQEPKLMENYQVMLTIVPVNEGNKLIARQLLSEYGIYLFEDLKLMAGSDTFFKELKTFPDEKYQFPNGEFFLAYMNEQAIGCAGLKRFDDFSCELKRMYIRPAFRGQGFGIMLTDLLLEAAKQLAFRKVLLDTNLEMPAAIKTYLKAGFKEIPAYCGNDNDHPIFMEYQF